MFMGLKNDYALYEVTRDGIDTVGVWGSNPHAPTNPLNYHAIPDARQVERARLWRLRIRI